jgi:hypothetical protein
MSEIAHILHLISPIDNISVFSLFSTVQLCNRLNNILLLLGFVIISIAAIHDYTAWNENYYIGIQSKWWICEVCIFINGKNIPNTA